MGLYFRRSIRIAPGVKLNFGKKSMSVSFGGRGARITYGTKGTTVSSGIPGTGVYYRKKLNSSKSHRNNFSSQSAPLRTKAANKSWGWVFIIMGLFCLYFPFFTDMKMMGKIIVGAVGCISLICSVAYFTAESKDDMRTYEEAHPDALIKNPFSFIVGLFLLGLFSYLLIKSFSWNDMSLWGWFFYPIVIFFLVFAVFGLYIGIKGKDAGDFKKDEESRPGALIKVPFVFIMGLAFFIVAGYLLYASISWKYMSFWGYIFYPVDIAFLLLGAISLFTGFFGENYNANSSNNPSTQKRKTKETIQSRKTGQASQSTSYTKDDNPNSSSEQDENEDIIDIDPNDSFPDVLKYLAEKKGVDYFNHSGFINSITNCKSLKAIPSASYFLIQLFYSGSLKQIISTTNFQQDAHLLSSQYAKSYGVQEEIALFIIQSFGYAMGIIEEKPQYNKQSSSNQTQNSQSQPSAEISTFMSNNIETPIDNREPYMSYHYPSTSLLNNNLDTTITINNEANRSIMERVESILSQEFGINVTELKMTNSNIVDYIECSTQPGSRLGRLNNNEDIFSDALSPKGIRLLAPIPGTNKLGIELPANTPHSLSLKTIFDSVTFQSSQYELPCYIGRTPSNELFGFDLTNLPHLLIAGASGQGKSSCMHNIIMSMLYKKHPNELKLILVDYKKIEFAPYLDIKDHFLAAPEKDKYNPVVSDDNKAKQMFVKLKDEFDARFSILAMAGVRNIQDYNTKFCNHRLNTKDGHKYLPYLVVIIDEYADLISSKKKWIEPIILDLIKKGRTVGIHLVIGINRPTADIIDSNIKNEITGRIAFKVNTSTDSRIILGSNGAEKLFSAGDALFIDNNKILQRVQCAEVKTEEIQRTCEYIMIQSGPTWPYVIENFTITISTLVDEGMIDPLFEETARCIILTQNASVSMIQRRLSIGYNRANHIMDQLERFGVVGKAQGINKREVLIADEKTLQVLLDTMKDLFE